ncbi:MAG: hypothetical protein ABSE77_21610 [Acidimicrobiales bacterium]
MPTPLDAAAWRGADLPPSAQRRYFEHQARWYLAEQTVLWDERYSTATIISGGSDRYGAPTGASGLRPVRGSASRD